MTPTLTLPTGWAIPQDLLDHCTRLVADDPDTEEASLCAVLERKVSQLWRPTQRAVGLAFFSESGDFFL
jgi:hypothetical protein